MKRTGFKSKNNKLARKPINRVGKKTTEWSSARQDVIDFFRDINIPWTCEAKLEGCTGELYLTLAHSKKRRDIKTPEELREVALLCSTCHGIVDAWKKENTEFFIKRIIQNRGKNNGRF